MHKPFLVLLLFISTFSQAQICDRTFAGIILDQHDASALSQALISIVELNRSTYTDEEGRFSFDNLCLGTYTLYVTHAQCNARSFDIKVKENTFKTLKLEHHYEELNEVLLSGSSEGLMSAGKDVLDAGAVERSSNESLGALVSGITGVSGFSFGNTVIKPSIHGLHSSRVTIMNNGVRMEDQEWGAEHAPNVDINLAQSIEIIKNASALQYSGDAIGGFVILKPQRIPVKDTLYGKVRLSAQDNGRGGSAHFGLIKSTTKGWYGSVEGTVKKYGDFKAPNYNLSNTGMNSYTLAGKLGFNEFKRGFELNYNRIENTVGILRASHLGGAQDQFVAINSSEPLIINDFTYDIDRPKQEVSHQIISAKAFVKSELLGRIDLRYDFQKNDRLEYDIRRGSDQNKASLDLDLQTHAVSLDLAPKLAGFNSLKTGVSGRYLKNESNPNTGVKRLIPDYKRYDLGLYAMATKSLSNVLELDAALRLDYMRIESFKYYYSALWTQRGYDITFPEFEIEDLGTQILTAPKFNYLNPSAAIGTSWSLNEQNRLLINLSLGARNPNPSELFSEGLHHSASRIEIGDLRFKPEIAKNLSLGYTYQNTRLSFNFNPFLRLIDRFILIEPTGIQQTIRGNFQVWSYRQTDVSLSGLDMDTRVAFNDKLGFEQQFSLVKGYEFETKTPLINMPPVNMVNALNYTYKQIEMRIESDYTWRQNEFPNTNFEAFIPETQSTELIDVSTPPEAYHLMNLTFRGPLNFSDSFNISWALDIQNMWDTSYRNYLNGMRFYADDLGRNVLLSITSTF
ncbi:MAG: hypothetical protein RIQ82_1202 [Bacteroidota bacterium]